MLYLDAFYFPAVGIVHYFNEWDLHSSILLPNNDSYRQNSALHISTLVQACFKISVFRLRSWKKSDNILNNIHPGPFDPYVYVWCLCTIWIGGRGQCKEGGQSQLNECSRQCSRPVLARCSMGFGPNPLINGLNLPTIKLNILFLEKFTVMHFD